MTTLRLKIKPGSKLNALHKDAHGNWLVKIKAPPVDGKANNEVIRFLSEILEVPKSSITLSGGFTSSYKRFHIAALSEEQIQKQLRKFLDKNGEV